MFDRFLKKNYQIALIFCSCALVSSCSYFHKDSDEPTRIRVVDLNGNPKEVKRYVPELNVEALAKQGYKVNVDTGELEKIPGFVANKNPAPINNQNNLPAVTDINSNIAGNQNKEADLRVGPVDQVVEYDLGGGGNQVSEKQAPRADGIIIPELEKADENNKNKKAKKFNLDVKKAQNGKSAKNNRASGNLYIQIGSYSASSVANENLNQAQNIASGKITEVRVGGKKYYRVLLGPFSSQNEADQTLNKVVSSGYEDAFVTKNKK